VTLPVKHGEGCYFADEGLLARLADSGQVVLRYEGETPNGSVDAIAGVVSEEGNVLGLMPHPEHAVDPLVGAGSTDGALILGSLVDTARDRVAIPMSV
jgi:phosphoribosylformylglycinamidine synthase